jgi:hypothetical protein
MKTRTSRLGLSILAGSLSFVGAASAIDIVIDGSYESSTNNLTDFIGVGGNDAAGIDGGWTHFSTYTYSANYTRTGPTGCGQVYLRPYNDSGGSETVSQIDSLTRAITPAQIDAANGQYTVSAWFSTYKGQNDYSDLTLQFLDTFQNPTGDPVALGGLAFVTALQGGNGLRAWGKDTKTGLIPPGARYASITTQSHAMVNLPDGYVDLVILDVVAGSVPVQIGSATPANGATGVSPGVVPTVVLLDGTSPLNASSVSFSFDGSAVTPVIQKTGLSTTVQYDPPGLLAASSAHSYKVVFNSVGGTTPDTTNEFSFTVAPYANVTLGTQLYLETFDELAEGALPAGWTVQNFTDQDIPGYDLNDFRSDAYLDWVVISRSTLSNLWTVDPGGPDFFGVTNVAPNQVVENQLVTNLVDGNFIFAVSDRANNEKQIQYLFTRDYNLSGKNNVVLSFHSVYTQNQDSLAAVEYSINGGATWLPALYMLDQADILLTGSGGIDASNTFAAIYGDVPNLANFTLIDGNYGQFIGVAPSQWSTLAPYISGRVDDDQVESTRVEVLRLTQADNQPAVRFRFASAGTWSWYWGIDNFGLYSLPTINPPLFTSGPQPAALTAAIGNSAGFTISEPQGTGPFSYQWRHEGTNLPGQTGLAIVFSNVQYSNAGTYDVVASNGGGSVTSPPPAGVLTVINPAVFVTGQWDFNGNLAATFGHDLEYHDSTVAADTTFGTTTSFGIPDINGQAATVMHFTPSTIGSGWAGYIIYHGAAPNGGGQYVNQYTLVYDLYYPPAVDNSWRALWQTATGNGNDGDVFLNPDNGIGISSIYNGVVSAGEWHRIAFAFDLSGPGEAPVLTKFIDGVKVGNQTAGLSDADGRFSLDPSALLFADNDSDLNEAYVSSVQFSNGRRPDAFLAALGGPSAAKIPGVIKASFENGKVVIRWTGGVPLEGADSVSGPWGVVGGANSPYEVTSPGVAKFYRPKIVQ